MRRAIRLIAILTVLVAAVTAASTGPATADPPGYFVDESKLPFAVLPGIATTRYWGSRTARATGSRSRRFEGRA
jgi:hypothetical protein